MDLLTALNLCEWNLNTIDLMTFSSTEEEKSTTKSVLPIENSIFDGKINSVSKKKFFFNFIISNIITL